MGKDLEDRWSFDMVLDNESSQNFHRKFRCTLPEQLNGNSPWFYIISRFIRSLPVIQDSRNWLGGKKESWHSFWLWILTKLSLKVQMDSPFAMKPSQSSSGTSWSSKTPGSDLEDRRSLDTVSDYGSWQNFHWRLRWIVPLLWHHLKVLTMDLDATFSEGSEG